MVKISAIFLLNTYIEGFVMNFASISYINLVHLYYRAISWKVVRKIACDNPKKYCGWFWVHCLSKKFERMAWEANLSK